MIEREETKTSVWKVGGHKVTYESTEPEKIVVRPQIVGRKEDGPVPIKPIVLTLAEAHALGAALQEAAVTAGFEVQRGTMKDGIYTGPNVED